MISKRKIVIFNVHSESKRLVRFKEEARKKDLDVYVVNSYSLSLTDRGIFHNGEEIIFNRGDIVWFVANPTINHYLAGCLHKRFEDQIVIWPNAQAIDLSDKYCASVFFSNINIPTPKTVLVNSFDEEKISLLAEKYVEGFPCVIKSCRGSMGKNVAIVHSSQDVVAFINKSIGAKNIVPLKRSSYLLQEFIKESAGSDYRALCLGGKILGIIKRTAQNGDFKANISLGGKAEVVEANNEIKEMATKIMNEGQISYAGIDFIKSNGGYLAIEINTSAQFKGFEAATGINVAERILENLLKMSDDKHEN
ncbi:MAG: alpha-L-glutamate ligase RimK family [Candidatus Moranbacteria bacterium GW2011_GWF2_34_56]|nr:MAG: alpha-L-glutamate ligase RimK family [Candidatus Moranbacteria bacterium GW2011_GWF1_34_10]KKP64852.1 MAG: alpha-L-glutamate ligase RimK family [Candidatus Moranbacteria bacterium GW2011_GWF2_34_56]HBI17704.1 hypothetical protein [Candidatus Moranbacteria bacterium]